MCIEHAADNVKAISISISFAFNAKAEQYTVCNAMETLLVADAIAAKLLPPLAARFASKGIELRGCARTRELLPGLDEAIAHSNEYGSQHTHTNGSGTFTRARRFLTEVDSASVMVNGSTKFAHGFEFGLGAEVRIATNKLHARGPVGIEGLSAQKFVALGDGQIRNRCWLVFATN